MSAAGTDDNQFPVQQVEFMGKTADCVILFPYGMHGNVSKDSLMLMGSVQGDESNRVAIAMVPINRPKMEEGELCIYHPPSGTITHYKANGDIRMTTPNLIIDGNLTVTGNTTLGATVTSNGKDISDTHAHTGSPTAPDGAQSDTGTPT